MTPYLEFSLHPRYRSIRAVAYSLYFGLMALFIGGLFALKAFPQGDLSRVSELWLFLYVFWLLFTVWLFGEFMRMGIVRMDEKGISSLQPFKDVRIAWDEVAAVKTETSQKVMVSNGLMTRVARTALRLERADGTSVCVPMGTLENPDAAAKLAERLARNPETRGRLAAEKSSGSGAPAPFLAAWYLVSAIAFALVSLTFITLPMLFN